GTWWTGSCAVGGWMGPRGLARAESRARQRRLVGRGRRGLRGDGARGERVRIPMGGTAVPRRRDRALPPVERLAGGMARGTRAGSEGDPRAPRETGAAGGGAGRSTEAAHHRERRPIERRREPAAGAGAGEEGRTQAAGQNLTAGAGARRQSSACARGERRRGRG